MRRPTIMVLVLVLGLGACGDDGETPAADEAPPTPASTPAPDPAPADADADTAAVEPGPDTAPQDEAPASSPASDDARFTAQIGAFLEADSGRRLAGALEEDGLPVWTEEAEVGGQAFLRVRVGAVPSYGEGQRLAELLAQRYEWPLWVAPVAPGTSLPADLVVDTRILLEG